jgi:radical SAM superfamily enzyme YgiQ (UPF0313 family)
LKVLFISTYDLGHQPFAVASPVAWLREKGHKVAVLDLSISPFNSDVIRHAELIAISIPMHTATRLTARLLPEIRRENPTAQICCYGLYAPLNDEYLRSLGANVILGGEFEAGLLALVDSEALPAGPVSLERLQFRPPDRRGLPALSHYPHLRAGHERKAIGYTEASRGCKHLCRHCPVVPVYNGTFRVVQSDVVLADVRQQVEAGAQHITFGDPDFFNGPTHARRIVEALHHEFPAVSYDVTIKVEHLLKHRDLLPVLRDTGCLFITSAVESVEDDVLHALDKGHTRADFIGVVELLRSLGLTLSPTFVPFTPWTTVEGYRDLLGTLVDLDLVDNVAPVQLGLRLLIPDGSRLLGIVPTTGFDPAALVHRWSHADPSVDELAAQVLSIVKQPGPRRVVFRKVWELAHGAPMHEPYDLTPRATIPYMEEPWYC